MTDMHDTYSVEPFLAVVCLNSRYCLRATDLMILGEGAVEATKQFFSSSDAVQLVESWHLCIANHRYR